MLKILQLFFYQKYIELMNSLIQERFQLALKHRVSALKISKSQECSSYEGN